MAVEVAVLVPMEVLVEPEDLEVEVALPFIFQLMGQIVQVPIRKVH